MAGIYLIKCTPTGELYVGGTKSPFERRFVVHRQMLRAGTAPPLLQVAHDAHGMEALEFIPLKEFPPEQVAERERQAVERLNPALNINMPAGIDTKVIAAEAGISLSAVYSRMKMGLTGEALTKPKHRAPRKQWTRRTGQR